MNGRDRFIGTMEYEPVDSVPNYELGAWGQAIERWRDEGLDTSRLHLDWLRGEEYFGMDFREWIPVDFGMLPPFEYEILEKDDRCEIYRDPNGVIRRALTVGQSGGTRASMDQFLSFPVENRQDFTELRKRYEARLSERYPAGWEDSIAGWESRDYVLTLCSLGAFGGFYWRAREWMGTENLSFAWYDQPDLMAEMMEFLADFLMEVSHPLIDKVQIDYLNVTEDFAMKNGPLLSPETYKRFIFPHLKRLVEFFKSHGTRYVFVDSDGDPQALVPMLMDAGVDLIWPLERAAGVDPTEVRREFGKGLRLMGGVDKRVLATSKDRIRDHLLELAPLVEDGGYFPTVDHTVPHDVSLENFLYYMDMKRQILGVGEA